MSRIHVIDVVDRTKVGPKPHWLVGVRAPDGTRIAHVFPTDALHWRAAEYGIDPADSRTLLDIVLHERLMADRDHDHEDPSFVFSTDVDTARRAHLGRVASVKERDLVTDPGGLLAPIHDHHRATLDPEAHATRLALADKARARNRKARSDG